MVLFKAAVHYLKERTFKKLYFQLVLGQTYSKPIHHDREDWAYSGMVLPLKAKAEKQCYYAFSPSWKLSGSKKSSKTLSVLTAEHILG